MPRLLHRVWVFLWMLRFLFPLAPRLKLSVVLAVQGPKPLYELR